MWLLWPICPRYQLSCIRALEHYNISLFTRLLEAEEFWYLAFVILFPLPQVLSWKLRAPISHYDETVWEKYPGVFSSHKISLFNIIPLTRVPVFFRMPAQESETLCWNCHPHNTQLATWGEKMSNDGHQPLLQLPFPFCCRARGITEKPWGLGYSSLPSCVGGGSGRSGQTICWNHSCLLAC